MTTEEPQDCSQPGCEGSIGEAGVCDLCGSPAVIDDAAPEELSTPTVKPPRAATLPSAESSDSSSPTATPPRPVELADSDAQQSSSPTVTPSPPTPVDKQQGQSVRTKMSRAENIEQERPSTWRTKRTRRRLGVGLVEVPEMPVPEADSLILADPQIPEDRRFCRSCGEPVGRTKGRQRGRLEGFCPKCRYPYSFVPKLAPGEIVGGQYRVSGCLAHGGLGWIYLAWDMPVDRRVVLKGLRDVDDPDAMSAAEQERRFLATLEHPNIVKIYNSVEHRGAGYLVMEYVGGISLNDLLRERREANGGKPDPLPVSQASAYMLEILPTFGYLHRLGLAYCDFKPANVILQHDALKLIDLGGAQRLNDESRVAWGTRGFQAPEIRDRGPSEASDLYTVGRTLAVVTLNFRNYQSSMEYALPPPASHPVLAKYESFYRFLLKATHRDRRDRFQSADEMADQLLGVLRQVVAVEKGDPPPPAASVVFAGGVHPTGETDDVDRLLPTLRVNLDDPAAPTLASLPTGNPAEIVRILEPLTPRTREIELRLARAELESGRVDEAEAILNTIEKDDPWEWRVQWYRGLIALAQRNFGAAQGAFDSVRDEVPGELAPILASAITAEMIGDVETASRLYARVSETDPSITSACFGLARCRIATGDRAGAVDAYRRVPDASSAYTQAQICAARVLLSDAPNPGELTEASRTIEQLTLDTEQKTRLTRDLLESALALLTDGRLVADEGMTIAGAAMEEQAVRFALERTYRSLARVVADDDERIELVDRANLVRPRTMV